MGTEWGGGGGGVGGMEVGGGGNSFWVPLCLGPYVDGVGVFVGWGFPTFFGLGGGGGVFFVGVFVALG